MEGMQSRKVVAHLFLLALGLAGPVAACEALVDTRDNRMRIAADGSFANGNIADPSGIPLSFPAGRPVDAPAFNGLHDMAQGNPVRDRGKGRIAQKIVFSNSGCNASEALLFVDCNGPQAILIFGVLPPDKISPAGMSVTSVAAIQPPLGPITIRATSTVDDLARTARRAGIEYLVSPGPLFAGTPERDRYDILSGCRLFYPDLAGAEQ
jgi:hypothetical protein